MDCNTYGADFRWGHFGPNTGAGAATFYINLNGCTIKNIMVADGATMFEGIFYSVARKVIISNGSILNVFMGSATSKICGDYVEFHNVSISTNVAGTTVKPFDGNGTLVMDNCALYLVASTLTTQLMKKMAFSDTDIELHVGNQNNLNMFAGCSFTDCRFTGKISGRAWDTGQNAHACVLGYDYGGESSSTFTNCVIDLDLTDSYGGDHAASGWVYWILCIYNSATLGTNVMCNSHYPKNKNYTYSNLWNYMSHENIRNGTYLNNAGFTVVEVTGS